MHTRTVLTAAAVSSLISLAGTTDDPATSPRPTTVRDSAPNGGPDASLAPTVTVTGGGVARRAEVTDVLQRFRRAGLELPDVEIVFGDDAEACHGHDGLFQESFTPWRIVVCSELPYVLPHELAHAWEAANLTSGDRRRYMDRFGFSTWDGRDVPWGERAEEHAAFVIQQHLMVTSAGPASPARAEKIAAYELLTET